MTESNVIDLYQQSKAGTGSLEASVDNEQFINTTSVRFDEASRALIVGGEQASSSSAVYIAIPLSLVGDGPHQIKREDTTTAWMVKIENQLYWIETSASACVTYSNDRTTVSGTFDIVLEDDRKVTGKFNISKG